MHTHGAIVKVCYFVCLFDEQADPFVEQGDRVNERTADPWSLDGTCTNHDAMRYCVPYAHNILECALAQRRSCRTVRTPT